MLVRCIIVTSFICGALCITLNITVCLHLVISILTDANRNANAASFGKVG